MALPKQHTEFRLPKVSYLEFKQIEMDRVLTNFFMRLYNNGYISRLSRDSRRVELTVKDFVDQINESDKSFVGFADHRQIVERWVETHLVDVVNRGKPTQAVTSLRPLHGFTYRMRNSSRTRDYGAAQHIYETLFNTRTNRGPNALDHLKSFFFQGYDVLTGKPDATLFADVETQAILNLMARVQDAPDLKTRDAFPAPALCGGAAELMADDILRLLAYRAYIPRTVMVDYLKILLAFHLALYHLRLFKLLPILAQRQGQNHPCAVCPRTSAPTANPHTACTFHVGLLVDVAAQSGTHIARLAQFNTDVHLRRIPGFIKAHYAVRKLDEFANEMVRRHKLPNPPSGAYGVLDLLALLAPKHQFERETFFGQRVTSLLADAAGSDGDPDPTLTAIAGLGLPEFETYIELLVAIRGDYHRKFISKTIDTVTLKGRPGALMIQPHSRAPRRFILDSRLLEVLLQIAVLRPGGSQGYYTDEMRIDDLLHFLRTRYGLHVDRLPTGEGFGDPSITDQEALRADRAAFVNRLREIGFYRDLSDAYVTQTVTPRYPIGR